jgi:hypothetical protein
VRVLTSATLVSILVAVLAACGSGSTASPSPASTARVTATATSGGATPGASSVAEPSDADASEEVFPSFEGEVGGSFTLVVEGSSLAGTYTSNNPTGACIVNAGQLQLALEAEGAGPDGANLFVSLNSVLTQATAGTNQFLLTVAFGIVDEGGTVAGYPGPGGNDGNLRANDRGSSITVEANGTAFGVAGDGSSESMKLRLQAECTSVTRF